MSFPRVCGVVPLLDHDLDGYSVFSSHMRGCSWQDGTRWPNLRVLPAHAGLFQGNLSVYKHSPALPAPAGLFPITGTIHCSRSPFPAFAGLFPNLQDDHLWKNSLPAPAGLFRSSVDRLSGDGLSPRVRGCSADGLRCWRCSCAFPRVCGVVPDTGRRTADPGCLPRPRGVVPLVSARDRRRQEFSPRMWGCS